MEVLWLIFELDHGEDLLTCMRLGRRSLPTFLSFHFLHLLLIAILLRKIQVPASHPFLDLFDDLVLTLFPSLSDLLSRASLPLHSLHRVIRRVLLFSRRAFALLSEGLRRLATAFRGLPLKRMVLRVGSPDRIPLGQLVSSARVVPALDLYLCSVALWITSSIFARLPQRRSASVAHQVSLLRRGGVLVFAGVEAEPLGDSFQLALLLPAFDVNRLEVHGLLLRFHVQVVVTI